MELKNTTLDDVAAVIGFSAAVRLSAWFGGGTANLYVPRNVEPGQLLVKLIGLSAAQKLTQEWGHQHLAIPRLHNYDSDIIKQQIGKMFERGFTAREIGRNLRMGERRVQQICQELSAAGLLEIDLAKNAQKNAQKNAPEKEGGKSPGSLPSGFFGGLCTESVPQPTID